MVMKDSKPLLLSITVAMLFHKYLKNSKPNLIRPPPVNYYGVLFSTKGSLKKFRKKNYIYIILGRGPSLMITFVGQWHWLKTSDLLHEWPAYHLQRAMRRCVIIYRKHTLHNTRLGSTLFNTLNKEAVRQISDLLQLICELKLLLRWKWGTNTPMWF